MSNLLKVVNGVDTGTGIGGYSATLHTTEGQFIDFFTDNGVVSMGYDFDLPKSPPHLPHYIKSDLREEAAKVLCDTSGMDKTYFCNSGSEAVESMMKFARKYQVESGHPNNKVIYTLEGAFHGRTYGAMTASTAKPYHSEGFGPLLPEVVSFINPMFDICWSEAAAVVLTPAKVYGDFQLYDKELLGYIVKKCKEWDVLLCFDEVQTYLRTGNWWGYQMYKLGIEPDMIATAKGVAGGFPTGVMLMKERIANTFQMGSHFSTFGANPRSCKGVIKVAKRGENLLPEINRKGAYIKAQLDKMGTDPRGKGLIIAFDYEDDSLKLRDRCLEKRLILGVFSSSQPIKLTPPLTVTWDEIRTTLDVISECL